MLVWSVPIRSRSASSYALALALSILPHRFSTRMPSSISACRSSIARPPPLCLIVQDREVGILSWRPPRRPHGLLKHGCGLPPKSTPRQAGRGSRWLDQDVRRRRQTTLSRSRPQQTLLGTDRRLGHRRQLRRVAQDQARRRTSITLPRGANRDATVSRLTQSLLQPTLFSSPQVGLRGCSKMACEIMEVRVLL